MTVYFIDFENVHEGGLAGLADLPEGDRVHLFYTINANKISFDFFEIISNSNTILHKVSAGKQALDMMLSSFLGFCVASTQDARFVIISKDRDYVPVVNFWNTQAVPVDVEQYPSIAAARGVAVPEEEPEAEQPQETSSRSYGRRGGFHSRGGRTRSYGSYDRAPRVNAQPAPQAPAAEKAPEAPAEGPAEAAVPEALEPAEALAETVAEAAAPVNEAEEEPETASEAAEVFAEAAPAEEAPAAEETVPGASEVLEVPSDVFDEVVAAVNEAAEMPESAEAEAADEAGQPDKKPGRRNDRRRGRHKEAPAAQTEAEKPAEQEARPITDKQRAGQESNAVHNAVQKALSQEKVDTNTIAFLASLTAKNYGKPNDKQVIYRAVIKQYGQKEGLRLYGIMKNCFKG